MVDLAPWSAIARMQYRAFLNSMRRGARKDPLPTGLSVLVSVVTTLLSLLVAAAFGFALAAAPSADMDPDIGFWMIAAYGLAGLVLSVISSISGETGAGLADARSLQLFPLDRGQIERLDLAAQFLSPSVLMFLPGFIAAGVGAAIGRVLGGQALLAPLAFAGVITALICDVTLVRVASSFIATGGRRMREWVILLFASAIVVTAYSMPDLGEQSDASLARAAHVIAVIARATWLGAGADLAVGGVRAPGADAISHSVVGLLGDVAVLVFWTVVVFALHRRTTRRTLDGEGGYHARVRTHREPPAFVAAIGRLLPKRVLGVALTDARTMLRIPMMWFLLLLPAMFGIFVGGRNARAPGADPQALEQLAKWTLPMAALGAHVLFSSQLFANLFGIDRDAAAHWILTPIRPIELFLGKAISRIGFGALQVIAFLVALGVRTPGMERGDIALAWFSWLAAAAWVSAGGLLLSVRMPVPMTFGQQREQRFERAATNLFSQFATAILLVPAAAMILGGRLLAGHDGYVAGIVVTAVSGLVLWPFAAIVGARIFESRATEMVDALSTRG